MANVTSEQERPNTSSVFFKSSTDRFCKIDGQNPNIRILDKSTGPRKGSAVTINKHRIDMSMSKNASTHAGSGNLTSYIN